ncbi:MAG: helix-turn-helix domain-containing protein [Candidatus Gracilibacteria bacterium]
MRVTDYIFQSLIALGLTDREAAVYLFLLKKSPLTASELAYKKGLSIAGAYKIIHSLLEKKMIELEENKRPFRFKTTSLQKLTKYFEKQGRQWYRRSQQIKQLSHLEQLPEKSEFIVENELSDFYLKLLSETPDFMGFMATYEAIVDIIGKNLENAFVQERIKKGFRAEGVMFQKTPLSEELCKRNWREKREFRYFPIKNYPCEFTYVYGDKVASFSRSDEGKVEVVNIHSPSLARARLMQIQAMWNSTRE